MINFDRIKEALEGDPIPLPAGLSREDKIEYIKQAAEAGDAISYLWLYWGGFPIDKTRIEGYLK